MKILLSSAFILSIFFACKKPKLIDEPPITYTDMYTIVGRKIYNYNTPKQYIGANALHTFGGGSYDMNSWKLDIVREFVGNMRDNPLTGAVLQDATGSYLHPLQKVVDSNRLQGKITLLCPFGWDGTAATEYTGKRPTTVSWYAAHKAKLMEWATHFKNQPDVWLELWNEPYRYDRTDGYTDAIWVAEMNEMVATIRTTCNTNIVLVPVAEQGQDESVLINKASSFLQNKKNILFDIHAYEKWLLVANSAMGNRLQQLQQYNIPVLFGETAPVNAGVLMNPTPLLDSLHKYGISTCAWLWKYDTNDQDALLTTNGMPNNTNNNNWGSSYKLFSTKPRNP